MLYAGEHFSPLTYCIRLTNLEFDLYPDESWPQIVALLHESLSSLSSPALRTIRLNIFVGEELSKGWNDMYADFGSTIPALNMTALHAVIARPMFDLVRSVIVTVPAASSTSRATPRDKSSPEHYYRSILAPWAERGILAVKTKYHGWLRLR